MYAHVHLDTMRCMKSTEMSSSLVRIHWADVLHRAAVGGQITYVTIRGRRVAAVVPLRVAEAAERAEQAPAGSGEQPSGDQGNSTV